MVFNIYYSAKILIINMVLKLSTFQQRINHKQKIKNKVIFVFVIFARDERKLRSQKNKLRQR